VHVLLLGAAGAGALRPQFLSELAPEARGSARRVEDALLLRPRVQITAYKAASLASKSALAAASVAMSSPG
jgi:hypothetical protein